jgi:cytidylate kinase
VTRRLKDQDVTSQVYRIAGSGDFRAQLVRLQRNVAEPRGVVAEGRDMGTVIFPEADFKFYLDARPEERARRQHEENLAAGRESSLEKLLESILLRDQHDREREHAPLQIPGGAIVIDTSPLTAKEVAEEVLRWVRKCDSE